MVEQEDKCHIEDRVHAKAEGMDKQYSNMGWLLQGIQLSKWKSFKDKNTSNYLRRYVGSKRGLLPFYQFAKTV